ncbi:hypothetical protein JW898_02600 [Candidatus Woesearchaeota archaeon]|nr:hypothetical protein [Candidatus Woesearchaeota archaeon]
MEANTAYRISQYPAREGSDSSTSYFCRADSDHERKKKELTYMIRKEIDAEIHPHLREISHRFAQGITDLLYTSGREEPFPTRRQTLDYFDRSFMQRELRRVKGNITQYARDALGAVDEGEVNNLRRNVYRQIEKYGLGGLVDAARPWKQTPLEDTINLNYVKPDKVETTLTGVLSGYKNVINPGLYDDISARIKEKAPVIAERISPYAPTPENRLKDIMGTTEGVRSYTGARQTFERQVVYDALSAAGFDKSKAAKYLGDSLRTLNRRIAELGMEEQARKGEQTNEMPRDNVVRIDEFVQKKLEPDMPPRAVGEIERFQQLVREYNARRESAREKKGQKNKQQKVKIMIAD